MSGRFPWDSLNYGAFSGSGFAALATGCRVPDSYPSDYYYLKVFANFWTASLDNDDNTQGVYLQLNFQG